MKMKTICKLWVEEVWSQICTNSFNMKQKTYVRPYCLNWKHSDFHLYAKTLESEFLPYFRISCYITRNLSRVGSSGMPPQPAGTSVLIPRLYAKKEEDKYHRMIGYPFLLDLKARWSWITENHQAWSYKSVSDVASFVSSNQKEWIAGEWLMQRSRKEILMYWEHQDKSSLVQTLLKALASQSLISHQNTIKPMFNVLIFKIKQGVWH